MDINNNDEVESTNGTKSIPTYNILDQPKIKNLPDSGKFNIPQKAFKLLIGVGGFIALISIIIICFCLINLIRLGIPTTTLTETELADFESLSKIFFDHTTQLFDLIITKGFLPIFATILGYLLGESRATNE